MNTIYEASNKTPHEPVSEGTGEGLGDRRENCF